MLEDKLLAAFGLPPGSPELNLLLVDGPTAGSKVLKIDTQLATGFSKSLPINLDLGLDPLELGGDADLLAQGSLRWTSISASTSRTRWTSTSSTPPASRPR